MPIAPEGVTALVVMTPDGETDFVTIVPKGFKLGLTMVGVTALKPPVWTVVGATWTAERENPAGTRENPAGTRESPPGATKWEGAMRKADCGAK
jgi:hypothetical protein